MKLSHRRQILRLAAGAAALPTMSSFSIAQAYPTRPVRWIVAFPPGGGNDITARLIGQSLSERLRQPVIIENRPGANGNIGTEAAVNAPSDGYTLLLTGTFNVINTALYDKLNFNFLRDIAPVGSIVRLPMVMEVNPSFPANTVSEFIAYAKANPGKINMASAGNGNSSHVAGELFKMMTGINMVHVPYRGSAPALTDLIGGQVQVMFDGLPSSIEYIRSGKLRPLAMTMRSEVMRDIPAVSDFLPGYEASSWYGIGVPKNTPIAIIDMLNEELNATLADPKVKARLADFGLIVTASTPADFGKLMADETEKWARVIRFAGIKAD
jgi:tripartite-type tricarboxylate transporter receptor subunit TctC